MEIKHSNHYNDISINLTEDNSVISLDYHQRFSVTIFCKLKDGYLKEMKKRLEKMFESLNEELDMNVIEHKFNEITEDITCEYDTGIGGEINIQEN